MSPLSSVNSPGRKSLQRCFPLVPECASSFPYQRCFRNTRKNCFSRCPKGTVHQVNPIVSFSSISSGEFSENLGSALCSLWSREYRAPLLYRSICIPFMHLCQTPAVCTAARRIIVIRDSAGFSPFVSLRMDFADSVSFESSTNANIMEPDRGRIFADSLSLSLHDRKASNRGEKSREG